jgi:hypothetical protein
MQVIWVKREVGIFFDGGLDDPNQIDLFEEISLFGHELRMCCATALSLMLFAGVDQFDVLLEQRIHQRTQRDAPRRGPSGQIVQHLRLQMNRGHEARALAKELAAIGFREVIFILHRITLPHIGGLRAASGGEPK